MPLMYYVAGRYVDRQDVEDLVQDAMVDVLYGLSRQAPEDMRSWLRYRIKCAWWRKWHLKRRPRADSIDAGEGPTLRHAGPSPEEIAVRREERAILRWGMDQFLSPAQRLALVAWLADDVERTRNRGRATLSESNVKEILSLAGEMSKDALAARYGVSRVTIWRVLTSRTWGMDPTVQRMDWRARLCGYRARRTLIEQLGPLVR